MDNGETYHGERYLERVPSLTESEHAFLSEAILNGEDTTTHVLASSHDVVGGFTNVEMSKLLGPSPENIVGTFGKLDENYYPFDLYRKLHPICSISLPSYIDTNTEISHFLICKFRSKGFEIFVYFGNSIVLLNTMHGHVTFSDKISLSNSIIRLLDFDEKRYLSISELGISQVVMENEKFAHSVSSWIHVGRDKIKHVSEISSFRKLALVTSHSRMILFDVSTMKLSAAIPYCFGNESVIDVEWKHYHSSELACSTDCGFLHILDIRYPLHRAQCLGNEAITCHTFINDTQVLVGSRSGLLQLYDLRRSTFPVVSYRDPMIQNPKSISCSSDKRRIALSGENITSIWDIHVRNIEVANIMHVPIARTITNHARIQKTSWVGEGTKFMAALDTAASLCVYDLED